MMLHRLHKWLACSRAKATALVITTVVMILAISSQRRVLSFHVGSTLSRRPTRLYSQQRYVVAVGHPNFFAGGLLRGKDMLKKSSSSTASFPSSSPLFVRIQEWKNQQQQQHEKTTRTSKLLSSSRLFSFNKNNNEEMDNDTDDDGLAQVVANVVDPLVKETSRQFYRPFPPPFYFLLPACCGVVAARVVEIIM
jgi:hypothetical protein